MSESCRLVRSQNPDSLLIRCSTHGWVGDQTEWDGISPCPYALSAGESDDSATDSAPPVEPEPIEPTPSTEPDDVLLTALRSSDTFEEFLRNGGNGAGLPTNVAESLFRIYKTYEQPSAGSMPHFKRPRTAMEFAAQANRVATMILNGEMDVETGRLYSSVARTVAQSLSSEVSRARYLQHEPDLTFPEE